VTRKALDVDIMEQSDGDVLVTVLPDTVVRIPRDSLIVFLGVVLAAVRSTRDAELRKLARKVASAYLGQ
jgi:hypothetical protein